MIFTKKSDLRRHVLKAYEIGASLDLNHCIYGPSIELRGFFDETMSYYKFLAGHCIEAKVSNLLEIGTHYGGSTMAFLAGMKANGFDNLNLVTMDITNLNSERLSKEEEIYKIIGDSTNIGVLSKTLKFFPSKNIDLVYIDALKDPVYVLNTMYNIFSIGLVPEWLILDDVQMNDGMRSMWEMFEKLEPESSFLISGEFPHIRKSETGFGIINIKGNSNNLLSRVSEIFSLLNLPKSKFIGNKKPKKSSLLANINKHYDYPKKFTLVNKENIQKMHLSIIYALTKNFYKGFGEIVDVGTVYGATTAACAAGLKDNMQVKTKLSRITSIDDFVYKSSKQRKVVNSRVKFGESLIPIYKKNISKFLENINTIEAPIQTINWCGKPIEIMVIGDTLQMTNAHVMAKFTNFLLPTYSILIHREFNLSSKPWVTYVLAYLKDNFELINIVNGVGVFLFKKEISPFEEKMILDNRFSQIERIEMIIDYAMSIDNLKFRLHILSQAAHAAIKYKKFDYVKKLVKNIESLSIDRSLTSIRDKEINKIKLKLKDDL